MFILIETLFYSFYFFHWIYTLVDKKYIFSVIGSKLEKYYQKKDPLMLSSNLEKASKNYFSLSSLFFKISHLLIFCKKRFSIFLFCFSMIIFKISITYAIWQKDVIIVSFFHKKIDLVSSFSNYFPYFKYIYYSLFSFFCIHFSFYCVYQYTKFKHKNSLSIENNKKLNYLDIPIGMNEKGNKISIVNQGVFQNILIVGAIGSGKTSSAISDMLDGFLKNNIFGFVIDVKGTYLGEIKKIAHKYKLDHKILSITLEDKPVYQVLNTKVVSINELAYRLRKVIELFSSNQTDTFWLDKVESYTRDFLLIIQEYQKEITFFELHELVNNKNYLLEKLNLIKKNLKRKWDNEEAMFNIYYAINEIQNEYLTLDERTIGIIKAEITRITNIFVSDYKVYQAFCSASNSFDFYQDKIIVFSMNIGENSKLAKVMAAYLKLDFQSQVLASKNHKPIFFICDEFQEVAHESDQNFFALSREYQCSNVISMQSYTSLIVKLNSEEIARSILQNFMNKIFFRNTDIYTVNEMIKQIGKEEKSRYTNSFSENNNYSNYSIFRKNFISHKSGISESISFTNKEEYIFQESVFTRELKTFEAVALISDGESIELIRKLKLKRWGIDENK